LQTKKSNEKDIDICVASSQEVVVLPSDVHGQYELLIEVNGVSYKGEISL